MVNVSNFRLCVFSIWAPLSLQSDAALDDSGTLLVKNASERSRRHITVVLWVSCWYTTSQTSVPSTVQFNASTPHTSTDCLPVPTTDIRTWHQNIEQHASEGVNKILIGNKSDWVDKKAITTEQGHELANEFGIKFLETSAKVNDGVEDAFFTLARYVY